MKKGYILFTAYSIAVLLNIFSCSDSDKKADPKSTAAIAILGQQKSASTAAASSSPSSSEAAPGDNALAKGTFTVNKYFGASPFVLNSTYTTDSGNTVTITDMKYWLSNLKFIKADGTEVSIQDSYYFMTDNNLIPADGDHFNAYPARKREDVDIWIPYGEYKGVKYSIGVDSVYNGDLGKHAGELSETSRGLNVNWMWFSSYIFTRVQGTCTSCTGTKPFKLDTGADSSYRTVTHNFQSNITVSKDNSSPKFVLKMDVKKLFTGIDIQTLTTSGGKRIIGATTPSDMTKLADNTSGSTSLVSASSDSLSEANRVLVTLEMSKFFDSSEFKLGTQYTNSAGNQLTFSSFRYYLSNVNFIKADGTAVPVYKSYYAMEMNNAETADGANIPSWVTWEAKNREKVFVYIPADSYTSIQFSIGVDPTYNDDMTKQAGDLRLYSNLTQDNGWMWFTSYIFSRMKGTCSNCASPQSFTLDTGSNSSYRTVTVPFGKTVTTAYDKDVKVKLKLDISKLFTSLNVGSLPGGSGDRIISATTPTEMTTLSNNYSSAFSLIEVTSAGR